MGHPDRLLTKSGAVDGDVLVLTKPLGSGIITTAAKVGQAAPAHLSEAVRCMKQLNWAAAEVAEAMRLRAATDITGFGLLGHAWEIAEASGVGLRFHLDAVPFLSGAKRYAAEGLFPGGAAANCATYGQHVRFNGPSEEERMLLYDPQTSGGLLVAVPPEKLDSFRVEMAARNEPCWVIGEVAGSEKVILVS
jgi:selenide,water dikinase